MMLIQYPKSIDNNSIPMKIILLFLLTAHLACSSPFKRYTDYKEYLAQWKKIVQEKYIHDVSDMALDGQTCYDEKCLFFYYESEDLEVNNPAEKKTVLLVSGMHGDEFLGPHTLLYAYKHLRAYKIIYFPMANPSGFLKNTRETFPGKIDLNRDFPVDGNNNCYEATATRILDSLFRKYKFDLTVALHNGCSASSCSEIGFNWGTVSHKDKSHTEEYSLLHDIGEMLQRVGGESKALSLEKFRVGTMTEVVYQATGTFDDWAYAAGKFPQFITKCSNFQYQPYPKDMANGLVFLIELGPKITSQLGSQDGIQLSPTSDSSQNGLVARGIRMLKGLMNVIHPTISFKYKTGNQLKIFVEGCKTAKVTALNIKKLVNSEWINIFTLPAPITIEGDLKAVLSDFSAIQVNETVKYGDYLKQQSTFECDSEWQGQGTTSFAQKRAYLQESIKKIEKEVAYQSGIASVLSHIDEVSTYLAKYTYEIGIVSFLILCGLLYGMSRRCCSFKKKAQKFEEVEYHAQSQQHTTENEDEMGGDLHTARGGIIEM